MIVVILIAPADVGAVSLLTATSTSLVVTWSSPEVPNGLITDYSVEATPYPTMEGHTGNTWNISRDSQDTIFYLFRSDGHPVNYGAGTKA